MYFLSCWSCVVFAIFFPAVNCMFICWIALIEYTQPVLVKREDPNSRTNTIKEIHKRAHSGGKWPQIIIFPEGTCTNRSCLINFKSGTVKKISLIIDKRNISSNLQTQSLIVYNFMNFHKLDKFLKRLCHLVTMLLFLYRESFISLLDLFFNRH